MAVRMKDIAEELGVSLVTVSKVLRNKPDVGDATRQRVLKRVRELNYRPNMLARGLASGKSYSIGLVVPDLVYTFFAETAKGVSARLREESYQLILASSEEDPALELQQIEHLLARGVDALLIASCQTGKAGLKSLVNANVPYILLDRMIPKLHACFVGTNDASVGYMATEHLIQLKRKRIAHIAGEVISTSMGRLQGYKEALEARRIPFREELVVFRSRLEEEGVHNGRSAMNHLLKLQRRPDAVFCYNDLAAIGAIRCLLDHKLRVPEDVAVIGCGNLSLAGYLEVPLSSIDQAPRRQGEQAARLALSMIADEQPRRKKELLIEPRLIARESTLGRAG